TLVRSAAVGRWPASPQVAAKKLPRIRDSSGQRQCLNRDKNAVSEAKRRVTYISGETPLHPVPHTLKTRGPETMAPHRCPAFHTSQVMSATGLGCAKTPWRGH